MPLSHYDMYSINSFNSVEEIKKDKYDLFISSYNKESMVVDVYNNIQADNKLWCLLPDYDFQEDNLEINDYYIKKDIDIQSCTLENEFIEGLINDNAINTYKDKRICIDITGFVKPYMIYFVYALKEYGFKKIDIIYSEPKYWEKLDETEFSKEEIISTRPINGFERRVEPGKNDLHIIAAGYDHKLVRTVAGFSKMVKHKEVLIGFPSLQPSMYQENILNFQEAADELAIDNDNFEPLYAPANDPFETAKVLKMFIDNYIDSKNGVNTIYLSPLSTKPHALGMLLFFLYEKEFYNKKGIQIIILYPFTKAYSSSAGKQLAKINLYTLEFDS